MGRAYRRAIAFTCTALALMLAACGSTSTSKSSTGTHPTRSPYTVAMIADQTGTDASNGSSSTAALQVWAKLVNRGGGINGHPVQLNICNSQSTAAGGAICGQKFSSQHIVLVTSLIGPLKAALPSLAGDLVLGVDPVFFPTSTSTDFQVFAPQQTIFNKVFQFARTNNITRVGLIATSDAVGQGNIAAVKAPSAQYGIDVPIQTVASGSVDDSVPLLNLINDHVGMIYLATDPVTAANILRSAKSLGLHVPIMVNSTITSNFLSLTASYRPKVLYATAETAAMLPATLPKSLRKKAQIFANAYHAKTGKDLDSPSVGTAEAAYVAEALLKHLGPTASAQSMADYLHTHVIHSLVNLRFNTPGSNVGTGFLPSIVEAVSGSDNLQPLSSEKIGSSG